MWKNEKKSFDKKGVLAGKISFDWIFDRKKKRMKEQNVTIDLLIIYVTDFIDTFWLAVPEPNNIIIWLKFAQDNQALLKNTFDQPNSSSSNVTSLEIITYNLILFGIKPTLGNSSKLNIAD